mgnify:CR=1 FL=1
MNQIINTENIINLANFTFPAKQTLGVIADLGIAEIAGIVAILKTAYDLWKDYNNKTKSPKSQNDTEAYIEQKNRNLNNDYPLSLNDYFFSPNNLALVRA